MSKVAVIGAGISGLLAAYKLQNAGHAVTVFEQDDQPGGCIKSINQNNFIAETGPNSLTLKSESHLELITELGLQDSIVEADPKSPRFILKSGRLRKAPHSPFSFLTSDLFSLPAKGRILCEVFSKKSTQGQEETLAQFTKRHFGQELLDYAIDPFVCGVYASSPHELSAKYAFPILCELESQYGSILRGFIQSAKGRKKRKIRIATFQNGMQALPLRIAEKIADLRLNTPVTSVKFINNSWQINSESFDHAIITTPFHSLQKLGFEDPNLIQRIEQLRSLPYTSMNVVTHVFKDTQFKKTPEGFGFLVPSKEKSRILGTLFNSAMFPQLKPRGSTVLTTFIGGSRLPDAQNLPNDVLGEIALQALRPLLNIRGRPLHTNIIKWPQAIPQYTLEYKKYLNLISNIERNHRGIQFLGNFKNGIGLSHCIENALQFNLK